MDLEITSEEKAYLDLIRREPDLDEPREAFADWLDSKGQSDRAQFIRLQLRLASFSPNDPGALECEVEACRLLEHGKGVIPIESTAFFDPTGLAYISYVLENARDRSRGMELGRGGDGYEGFCQLVFNRGIVERARFEARAFLACGEFLFEKSAIRELFVEVVTDGDPASSVWGAKAGGHYLDIGDQVLIRLEECLQGVMRNHPLRKLVLSDIHCEDPDVLGAVLRSPAVRQLELLAYQFGRLGPEMMWEFAASPMLRGLKSLTLGAFGITDAGVMAFALSPYLSNLEEIEIRPDDTFKPGNGWKAVCERFGDKALLDRISGL
jgi:uncharacterized protein (TIGR02996 family)